VRVNSTESKHVEVKSIERNVTQREEWNERHCKKCGSKKALDKRRQMKGAQNEECPQPSDQGHS
jgi:hypothetical protein